MFDFVIVPTGMKFFGENHVNVLLFDKVNDKDKVINKILQSLNDERTKQFVKMFVGNGALSKTEIQNILPIFK